MSEAIISEITPQQGATNETVLGDFSSYFRWNEESRVYEINGRINPANESDYWAECPSRVYDRIANPNTKPTVGEIIYAMNSIALSHTRDQATHQAFSRDAYSAIEIIGRRLLDEAEKRGWCDEFDTIIDEVNDELPGPFALPVREKEYEVEWQETFTVTVNRSATYTARSAEDAIDMAREEDIDSSDLIDAIRNGQWDTDYGDPDYEVSEV